MRSITPCGLNIPPSTSASIPTRTEGAAPVPAPRSHISTVSRPVCGGVKLWLAILTAGPLVDSSTERVPVCFHRESIATRPPSGTRAAQPAIC